MSTRRKPNSGDPRKHPGNDELVVIYPAAGTLPPDGTDLDMWLEQHPPETKADHVTRDEFTRRMAGNPILDTVHGAGRDTRVIALAEPSAILQWWNTAS